MRCRWAITLLLAAVLTACADPSSSPPPSASAVPTVFPTVSLAAPTVPDFPTADSTGLPAGFALRQWRGETRTSELDAGTTEVDGRSCKLIERLDIALGDTGRYLYVDDTCVVLRNVRVTTLGTVENTSAMVQQAETNVLLVVESSVFDGGPNHQRGIQADHGELRVHGSRFVRFGNAAVEMNNRAATADITVTGSYFYEPSGWTDGDHVDGIQVGAAHAVTIRSNTVLIEPFRTDERLESDVSNSALGLWAELGDVTGPVLIEHNLLGGGGFVIYLAADREDGFDWLDTVTVRDNVFDTSMMSTGGIWGLLYPDERPAELTWQGNRWDDGRAAEMPTA